MCNELLALLDLKADGVALPIVCRSTIHCRSGASQDLGEIYNPWWVYTPSRGHLCAVCIHHVPRLQGSVRPGARGPRPHNPRGRRRRQPTAPDCGRRQDGRVVPDSGRMLPNGQLLCGPMRGLRRGCVQHLRADRRRRAHRRDHAPLAGLLEARPDARYSVGGTRGNCVYAMVPMCLTIMRDAAVACVCVRFRSKQLHSVCATEERRRAVAFSSRV